MKKSMTKVFCLLVSIVMVLTSLPLGVLAEELTEPSTALVNNESNQTDNLQVPQVDATDNTPGSIDTEPTLQPVVEEPQDTSQTMATAETLETMATETDGKYEFTVDTNNLAFITNYTGTTDTEVTIPETLTILPAGKVVAVAGIKAGAFVNCTTLTKVTISPNITSLEGAIFNGNVTIYGVEGSLADNYAVEWNLDFVKAAVFYVADFKSNKDSGVTIKTPITLTATVSTWSKTITSIKFYYDLTDYNKDTQPSIDIASGTATTATFTPSIAGTYTLYVKVTDSDSNTCIKTIDSFEVLPAIKLEATESSPQYVSTPLNLAADVDDGITTAAYDYQFSYQLGSVIKEIQASPATTCTFTPGISGAYTIKVTVKNQSGNKEFTGTKTLEYSIVDNVYVKSLTVDKLSPQEVGTALTLKAEAAGGKTTGYKYRFFYKLNGGTEVDLQDYADTASVVFKPADPGTYQFGVQVMNAMGVPSAAKTANMTIISTPEGTFTAAKADGTPFYLGDSSPIVLKVSNSSGYSGTLYYKYYYTLGTGTEKNAIGSETTSSFMNFTPSEKGTYKFYVEIIDKSAVNSVSVTKTVTGYEVYDKFVGNGKLTSSLVSPQNKGTTTKLTASTSGGKAPYTYAFSYLPPGGGVTPIGEASTSNTANLTMDTAGDYTISVIITDANGITETKTITYKINNNPQITKFEMQAEIAHYVNDPVNLTAQSEAGTGPYTYEFTAKLGSQTTWKSAAITNTNATDEAKASFTPTVAGTYVLEVKVRDSAGFIETKTIKDYKVLPSLAVKTLKTDKPSGQNIGTDIKLTATGSGGKSPYTYKFYYEWESATTQLTGGNYVDSSTVIFNPTVAGTYTLYVDVKDANGKIIVKAGSVSNYNVINAPVLASFSADKDMTKGETGTASIYPGDTINFKAKTTTNTGEGDTLSYQFYYKIGSTETPIGAKQTKSLAQKYDEVTGTFSPDKAGTYTVYVRVTDANMSKDDEKIATLKVLGDVTSKVVKVSKTTGVIVGSTIKLSATAAGGKSPYTYKFYFKKGTGILTLIDSDPVANTIEFPFTTSSGSGDYTFYVQVIDDNKVESGNTTDELSELLKTASPIVTVTNPPQLSNTEYSIVGGGSALYAGKTTIQLKAETANGTGDGNLTYQFFYKQGSTEIPIGAAITKTTPLQYVAAETDLEPDVAGTYTVYVRVTDAGNLKSEAKIGSFKVLGGVVANPVKVSKTTGLLVSDTIKLSAGGSGGQTPYNYQFYFKKGETGALTEIGSPSLEKSMNISFSSSEYGSGTYQFYVKLTDKNGEVSAADDTAVLLSASPIVTVTNPPNLSSVSYTKTGVKPLIADLYVGDTVELRAKAQNGSGEATLTYQFFYKQGTTEVKIGAPVVKTGAAKYDEATSDFNLSNSGTYAVYVRITDGTSTSVSKIGSLKVLDMISVKTVKASKTNGLIVGDKIKLTASGTGGKPSYKYEFSFKEITASSYTSLGAASEEKSIEYQLPTAGTYVFSVTITDANGVASTNVIASAQVTVGNPPVIESFTVTPLKGSAVYIGDEITLTAKVKAGSGIDERDWKFVYKAGTITKTVDPVVTGDVATAKIIATDPGTYTFTASVTDKNSSEAVKTISSYPVLSKVAVKSLTANLESGQNINTVIKLTATGVGGKAPYTYKFYSIYQDSVDPVYINTTYSSTNTTNFTPKKSGYYSLHVSIKDANGNICSNDREVCILDYEVIDNPIIKSFTADQTSGQYVDTLINLTATVSGGVLPYNYKFTYKLGSESEKVIDNTDGDQTAAFTPTKAGTYTFYVYVTDTEGNPKPDAKKEIKSFVIYDKPTVKAFTSSSTKITKGKSVTLKATVAGGQSPYQYRFYYSTGGVPTDIRKYSTTSSYSWTPKTAGTYTVYVDIMDAKGTETTSVQALTILVE